MNASAATPAQMIAQPIFDWQEIHHPLRMAGTPEHPLINGPDACAILGLSNQGSSLALVDADEKVYQTVEYSRLSPGMLAELQTLNPSNAFGVRHHRHHQHLTMDIGHPALQQHLFAILAMMRASTSWGPFLRAVDRSFPRMNETMALALDDDDINPNLPSPKDSLLSFE